MKAVESSETSFQRIRRNYYHTRTLARRFCSLAVQHIAELTDLAKFWLTQKGEQQKTGKPLGFCGGHFSSVRGSHETLAGVGVLGHVENMGLPEF